MRSIGFTLLMTVLFVASACSSSPEVATSADGERPSEADIYTAALGFVLSGEDEAAEGYSPDEGYVALTDRPVVYVVDHADGQVALSFCIGDDEFGEQPDVCPQMRAASDQINPLGPYVHEAIRFSLSDAERVEFVESSEQVTEPQEGIVLIRVINDGALLRFGPVIGEGKVVHLAVWCVPCGSATSWLLRLEQDNGGWTVEPVIIAIA